MKKSGIYQIRNKVNGNCYIGQSVDLNNRKSSHFSKLKNKTHTNTHLMRSVEKYGIDNFEFIIIVICEPSELTYYEQSLVDLLKPEYNIAKECVDSPKGIIRSPESRKKMSEGQKRRKRNPHSPETKMKMSLAAMGEKNHNFGKSPSKESVEKNRLANKGRKMSPESIEKSRLGNIGKHGNKLSEEWKKNIGNGLRGKKRPRQSELMTGRKHTEETKKKISDARKEYWKNKKNKREGDNG